MQEQTEEPKQYMAQDRETTSTTGKQKVHHQKETAYSRKKKAQEPDKTKEDVLSGRIPSIVADFGATSNFVSE